MTMRSQRSSSEDHEIRRQTRVEQSVLRIRLQSACVAFPLFHVIVICLRSSDKEKGFNALR
jgi:hypothetical protein